MHVVLVAGRRTGMDSQECVSFSFLFVILASLLSFSRVTVGSEELSWSRSSVPKGAGNELINSSLHPGSPQSQTQDESSSLMDSFSSPRSRSWFAAHNSDPSMGFFFGGSPSLAGQRSLQDSPPSAATNVRRRRRRDTTKVIVKTAKKAIKKKKDSVKKKSAKSGSSSGLTAVAVPHSQESSRTFLITTGIVAYLLPVFLAQMFGMGLIPAAGFILLPAFLLPIGLTAAVFLI